jgi:hypothetical protein
VLVSLTASLVFAAACGAPPNPVGPDTPVPVTPAPPIDPSSVAPPVARLEIRVAGQVSLSAIPGVSPITFDASKSTGLGLTFAFDFGDGEASTGQNAIATHRVMRAGQFLAKLMVTDAFGRTAADSRPFYGHTLVAAVTGWDYWRQEPRDPTASRSMVITKQIGPILEGHYSNKPVEAGSFTGTVTPEHNITITLDTGTTFTGIVQADSSQSGPSTRTLDFVVRGGPDDGKSLSFTRYTQ